MDPQVFYTIKGLVGVVMVSLMLLHMNAAWTSMDKDYDGVTTGISQRLRYLSLLSFAVLVTAASPEQLAEGVNIDKRNVGAMVCGLFGVFSLIVTIVEWRRKDVRRH